MSLATRVSDLATRIATEIKSRTDPTVGDFAQDGALYKKAGYQQDLYRVRDEVRLAFTLATGDYSSVTAGRALGVLPAGFRPPGKIPFVATLWREGYVGFADVEIDTAGNVTAQAVSVTNGVQISLNTSFRRDAPV